MENKTGGEKLKEINGKCNNKGNRGGGDRENGGGETKLRGKY